MSTIKALPEIFTISSNLETLTIKNVATDTYLVWSTPSNGPQVQHTEASVRELIASLKGQGWEIDEQQEGNY